MHSVKPLTSLRVPHLVLIAINYFMIMSFILASLINSVCDFRSDIFLPRLFTFRWLVYPVNHAEKVNNADTL